MRIAVIAITKGGSKLAGKLGKKLRGDVYVKKAYALPDDYIINGNFVDFVHEIFEKYDGFVFVMAAGIVVRAIAGVLKSKLKDPAVVVVDEKGKFAISLLSGHIGGANELAVNVAQSIGAQPVITTATDVNGIAAIDVIARDYGYYIENIADLKRVNSALANGKRVAVMATEEIEKIPELKDYIKNGNEEEAEALVYITDRDIKKPLGKPYVILKPRKVVLGIGCKKGVSFKNLLGLVNKTLNAFNINSNSIKCISTIDIKKEEKGLRELSKYFSVPLIFYSKDELKEAEDRFPVSDFVLDTVGVGSVARPCAYISSDGGEEITYVKGNGLTLAVYKCRKKG